MGSWITPELVGNESPRNVTLNLQHFAKEPFSSPHVPTTRHQDIQDVAVLIDSTPEIQLLSLNLHEQFIDEPDVTQTTLLSAQRSSIGRPDFQAPIANGFVGHGNATLCEQVFDVARAERESMVEPDCTADDLGRKSAASVAGFHAPIVADHADCALT